ncbi:MAG: GyrI-like domain-containing protein [Candidatus Heimdallarchaeota archaeon]|nr:GyrI-like domain-containing protein [Candidatus Heimdallarchaeota archaeon]
MMKLDYKKSYPEFYKPKNSPHIINIPAMRFFMIDGKGDPNTSQLYQNAVETLYAVSYTLKMKIIKKENAEQDYVVPPLEGLWFMDDMSKWSMDNRDDWQWTMMIRIPDFTTEQQIGRAIELTREHKNPQLLDKLYVQKYDEGTVVQQMYIGAYADEGPTISKMHDYAKSGGYQLLGKHHEIYLSDPRKVAAEKLKTIIRQPISK